MIVYFSGTGNSRAIAEKIAREGERVEEITAIAANTLEDDRIGLVFPVYCGDVPRAVAEFLKRVKFVSSYIFSIATAGGGAGRSHGSVAYLLEAQGTSLAYSDTVIMPDSCIAFATPEKTKARLLTEEGQRAEAIAKDLTERKRIPVKPSAPYGAGTRFMWKFFKGIFGLDRKKVGDSCVGCGLCAAGCPVNNIEMRNGKAAFLGGSCENCFRCIQSCPERAIEFGRLKVNDRTQYLHE